jgi:hypothetical protein
MIFFLRVLRLLILFLAELQQSPEQITAIPLIKPLITVFNPQCSPCTQKFAPAISALPPSVAVVRG